METPRWIKRIERLFFPARCACCGCVIPAGELLCPGCGAGLPRVEEPVCPRCGRGRAWCVCDGRETAYERIVAPFYYEGAVRRGILRMKYGRHSTAAVGLADFMGETAARAYRELAFDCVTPVPMRPAEKRTRGFNQSALLAREIARRLAVPCRETLRKRTDTKPQHRCAAGERRQNVRGVYEALPGKPGRVILLVDDVVTTGATLDECARALRAAGAETVCCAAVACVRLRKSPGAAAQGVAAQNAAAYSDARGEISL